MKLQKQNEFRFKTGIHKSRNTFTNFKTNLKKEKPMTGSQQEFIILDTALLRESFPWLFFSNSTV